MPFDDEQVPFVLVDSRAEWADEFAALAAELRTMELAELGAIDHIGSTSVPGLDAKDVLDVQVRLADLDAAHVIGSFRALGFRQRPEAWNNVETTRTGPRQKLVFAPPVGARRSNVHVRVDATTGATDALLFRDFLRSDDAARDAWNTSKHSLVELGAELDLATYGQAKQPAWVVLMQAADRWAATSGWCAPVLGPWHEAGSAAPAVQPARGPDGK